MIQGPQMTEPTNSQVWARSIALRAIGAVKERSIVELTDSQAWNILELAVGKRIPQSVEAFEAMQPEDDLGLETEL